MAKKVIVADDHEAWRGIYRNSVKDAFPDVDVEEVQTGGDLIERVLNEGDYSAVISDNDMEKKNAGLEALKMIRTSGCNVPFYLVSGGSSVVLKNALHDGANGVYDKADFDSDKLKEDLTKYLQ